MKRLLLALAVCSAHVAYGSCSIADIELDKLQGRSAEHHLSVTGFIVNNCAQATGVQIKVTVYDQEGRVIVSRDPWPASVSNIPARSTFPFEYKLDRVAGYKNFDVRVLRTRIW